VCFVGSVFFSYSVFLCVQQYEFHNVTVVKSVNLRSRAVLSVAVWRRQCTLYSLSAESWACMHVTMYRLPMLWRWCQSTLKSYRMIRLL